MEESTESKTEISMIQKDNAFMDSDDSDSVKETISRSDLDSNVKKFLDHIKSSALKFKNDFLLGNTTIKLISHLDADGISSASVMINLFTSMNINYSLSIVPELNPEILKGFVTDLFDVYVFTDLGSGYISDIFEHLVLNDKKVVILDHHEISEKNREIQKNYNDSVIEVNPHMFDIDGSSEISGSGVSYLFSKEIDGSSKEIAHIAIVGAIGDYQINDSFSTLNRIIINDAIASKKLKIIKGLKLFGAQTKPLYKVLSNCTDPFLPGVTGSDNGAIQFMMNYGISPKIGNVWKKLVNLTKKELEKLVEEIVMMRIANGHSNPEDIIGNVYILPNEEKESPLRDAREFATLLNACGRLNKASYGIGACLNEKTLKVRAINTMNDYKREIMKSLRWFEQNKKDPKYVIANDNYTIINAKDNIYYTMIGTIASILSHSLDMPQDHIIVALAQQYDSNTKVSVRITNRKNNSLNLKEFVDTIVKSVGGEAGGHKDAAGAIIPVEKEYNFIEVSKALLERVSLEQKVE